MDQGIALLITGALISLLSSFLTSIFNYRLTRRQWLEQESEFARKSLRDNLTFTLEDARRQGLGSLRGNRITEQEINLLPPAIAKLEVNKERLVERLKSKDESITLNHLIHLALVVEE